MVTGNESTGQQSIELRVVLQRSRHISGDRRLLYAMLAGGDASKYLILQEADGNPEFSPVANI
jgi:hypothetical protein